MFQTATLSLRQLENFDARATGNSIGGGIERRFLCPLCGEGKPKDAAHRCLAVNTQTGAWLCHRCNEKGKLAEWKENSSHDNTFDRRTLRRRKLQGIFALNDQRDTTSSQPQNARAVGQRTEFECRRTVCTPTVCTCRQFVARRGRCVAAKFASPARFAWHGGWQVLAGSRHHA